MIAAPAKDRDGQRLARLADAVRSSTIKRLVAFPHGSENWRPVESALSVGEIAEHILDADLWLIRKLREPGLKPFVAEIQPQRLFNRAEFELIIDRLRSIGAERAEMLARFSDDKLCEHIDDQRFGGDVELWWLIVRGNLDHEIHHRGQLAVYLNVMKHQESI